MLRFVRHRAWWLFSLAVLTAPSQAQPDRIILAPVGPTSYEQCRQFSADYYAYLVEIEMARSRCQQAENARPQGVSVSSKGVPRPNCGSPSNAYLSCAAIDDKWCAVNSRMQEATTTCYKAYYDHEKREQTKGVDQSGADARIQSATDAARSVRPAIANMGALGKLMFRKTVARPDTDFRATAASARGGGKSMSDTAASLTGAWVKRHIPDLSPAFFESTGEARLRELALTEAAFANAEFTKFYGRLAPQQLSAQSHALSSLVTVIMAKQLYSISDASLRELDRAFALATQTEPSRTSRQATVKKADTPVPEEEEEGGFISR